MGWVGSVRSELVLFDSVWFGLVWFGLVWFGSVRFGSVRFRLVPFGLVLSGLVWFDLVRLVVVLIGLVCFSHHVCVLFFVCSVLLLFVNVVVLGWAKSGACKWQFWLTNGRQERKTWGGGWGTGRDWEAHVLSFSL